MSKRGYISRYMLIVKKLKVKPYSSYDELRLYIEGQVEFLQNTDDSYPSDQLHRGFWSAQRVIRIRV